MKVDMIKIFRISGLPLLLGLLLTACGTAGGAAAESIREEAALSRRERENAPEGTVPDEEQLVVYTSHKPEVYEPILQEFEARTGIWVTVHAAGTNELMEEIRVEQGNPQADVLFGGGVESYEVNADLFQNYDSPERQALKAVYQDQKKSRTPFTELPIVMIYNHKLLKEEEAPRGYEDLLRENWKGKIAFADPGNSQSSATILSTMILALGRERREEILRRFAENLEGQVLESSGAVLDQVAEGNFVLGLTLEETARKYIDRGADLSILFPAEGTSAVSDACGIVAGAQHEENAKAFVDFIIGEDVQRLAEERLYRRSVRADREDKETEAYTILEYDIPWAAAVQQELLMEFSKDLEGAS